ncbi:hypothetical protein [Brevibacillus migulae]|uniref:hypothetical protein n=1 Tax=Brevibacillus migulae TaxID=1644114 RepID=UPI00106EE473|nr:hypothetical protein [Brevibacillus migulae]
MEHQQRKYQVINEQVVLFDEEYYLRVFRLPIESLAVDQRTELFDQLYAFEHHDVQLEIDVSEEHLGVWYLQLLVPHMLTLPEAAIRRMDAGIQVLEAYLSASRIKVSELSLRGEQIYQYVKRYNPHLIITS